MNGERPRLRQRRDLSAILETALALYRLHFATLIRIAAVTVPLGVAGAALLTSIDGTAMYEPAAYLSLFLQGVVNSIVAAAIIVALVEIDETGDAEYSRAYDVAFERLAPLLGALIRTLVIVIVLFVTIIGIPWSIQRIVRWYFIGQAVILDGTNAKDALSASAAVVEGRWWATARSLFVIVSIGALPTILATVLFSVISPLVAGVMASLVSALLLPFTVTAMTLLYLDLQVQETEAA